MEDQMLQSDIDAEVATDNIMEEPVDMYENVKSNNNCKRYNKSICHKITIVYIIAFILWGILILLLGFTLDYIGFLILCIPFIVYTINIINSNACFPVSSEDLFKANILSFGFLITIILLNWNSPSGSDKCQFIKILVVAFMLLMISMIDVWVSKSNIIIVNQIKSALQTASLALIALALYSYYVFQTSKSGGACSQST